MSADKHLWESLTNQPYCSPNSRMEFALLFDVKNGNPNGDPDAGNLPRMDPATRLGIVTDVCIKRKVRDYLCAVLGRPIYIQSQDALNTLYFKAAQQIAEYSPEEESEEERKRREADKAAVAPLYLELKEAEDADFAKLIKLPEDEGSQPEPGGDEESEKSFREWLADVDIDGLEFDSKTGVLTYLGEAKTKGQFQALFTSEEAEIERFKRQKGELARLLASAQSKKKGRVDERAAREVVKRKMCESYDDIRLFGAVLTAGTNAGQVRGPLQLTFASSTKPILPLDAAITRCAITRASDWTRKQTEFGRKPWLSYAVYRQHGFYNPLLGGQTGVTSADLARFWEALANMFQNSVSASKGEMATRDLVVFVHPNHWGKAPSHKLFGLAKTSEGTETGPSYKIEDEDKKRIEAKGIKIYRPLGDIWGEL